MKTQNLKKKGQNNQLLWDVKKSKTIISTIYYSGQGVISKIIIILLKRVMSNILFLFQ